MELNSINIEEKRITNMEPFLRRFLWVLIQTLEAETLIT